MANRRARTHAFYSDPGWPRGERLERSAAAVAGQQYGFRGEAVSSSVVVRVDINDYSSWVRDRPLADRVRLLDDLFSKVVPELGSAGGVYFRDEGDCIVCLFSDYFQSGATFMSAMNFCRAVVACRYGWQGSEVTVKASVALGELAFFQKAHEQGTDDWSAEGHAFVRAARLEQAIESKQQIVAFADDYDAGFAQGVPIAPAHPRNARTHARPRTLL